MHDWWCFSFWIQNDIVLWVDFVCMLHYRVSVQLTYCNQVAYFQSTPKRTKTKSIQLAHSINKCFWKLVVCCSRGYQPYYIHKRTLWALQILSFWSRCHSTPISDCYGINFKHLFYLHQCFHYQHWLWECLPWLIMSCHVKLNSTWILW